MIKTKSFLDVENLRKLSQLKSPSLDRVKEICNKALQLKGLDLNEAADLLAIKERSQIAMLLDTAKVVKQEIYGSRMVLFAPLYTGNHCVNNCLYCGFRRDNDLLDRTKLTQEEIGHETKALLKQGHKRVLLLSGESGYHPLSYTMDAIKTIYSTKLGNSSVRRINVEIAPLSVEQFKELKTADIGTYTCFQETYDPDLYSTYHPTGPKANYDYRLNVMHRAMTAGIDDVGIGVLFGLADYKFEVLSLFEHAGSLEKEFGCGPHTISVPRIESAPNTPLTDNIPFPVNDDQFKKIISIVRISMPYTGIILSTRETEELRNELFQFGISQASAGSRTSPGAYSENDSENNMQFSLHDSRSLDEVISKMVDDKFIPSFCTGCYRQGRVGNDFMDLAKPGLIKQFCQPNGLVSFAEYLMDYASESTKEKGFFLIEEKIKTTVSADLIELVTSSVERVKNGERDIYL